MLYLLIQMLIPLPGKRSTFFKRINQGKCFLNFSLLKADALIKVKQSSAILPICIMVLQANLERYQLASVSSVLVGGRNKPKFHIHGLLLTLIIASLQAFQAAVADEYATTIRQANVVLQDNSYFLNANIDYALSPAAKAALLKGIALSWTIPVVLKHNRDYFWDTEVFRTTLRYQVQYFALLNVYRVKAEHSGQVNNFSTLAMALNSISVIKSFRLIEQSALLADQRYSASLKVIFDREALPIPLRPAAYLNKQWFLSSDWYTCPL